MSSVDTDLVDTSVLIEVCTGPNCSSGGAAILEIEELIQENGSGVFEILKGGCRDLCTVGPNVHCRGIHFPRVKSPEDCFQVALEIGLCAPTYISGTSTSVVGNMMTKKANRLRWKTLRDMGNRTASTGQKIDEWQAALREAHLLETTAATMSGNSMQAAERANRRLVRLEGTLLLRYSSQLERRGTKDDGIRY